MGFPCGIFCLILELEKICTSSIIIEHVHSLLTDRNTWSKEDLFQAFLQYKVLIIFLGRKWTTLETFPQIFLNGYNRLSVKKQTNKI